MLIYWTKTIKVIKKNKEAVLSAHKEAGLELSTEET
jgi:hypothetical protein